MKDDYKKPPNSIVYNLPIRTDFMGMLILPCEITAKEASRLCRIIGALPISQPAPEKPDDESDTVEYPFVATGGLDVSKALIPMRSASGDIIGFEAPDGTTIDLAICLRVETPDGADECYVSSEAEMAALGFSNLDYDRLDFERKGEG